MYGCTIHEQLHVCAHDEEGVAMTLMNSNRLKGPVSHLSKSGAAPRPLSVLGFGRVQSIYRTQYHTHGGLRMRKHSIVTLAVVGLFLSMSFLASNALAEEKDGIMMKNGKIQKLQDGKDIGPMDRATTMANGTKVMMNGKIVTKDGQQSQLEEGQVMMLDGKLIDGKGMGK